MPQSKIDINVGGVSFSGEGEQAWLTEQLDKVLKAAQDVARLQSGGYAAQAHPHPHPQAQESGRSGVGGETRTVSLASYIREKGGEESQVDKFLIAANWLRLRGISPLTTAAVTKALRENQQKRLSNPADCLNKNVSKGYCEKGSGGFFITPDGLNRLKST